MRIELIDGGFIEIIENGVVEKVACMYDGTCTIHFYDNPPKTLNVGCSSYHSQYGIPVSEDGSKLFIGNWESEPGGFKKGLHAYDISTGTLLWRLDEGKIRHIFVYQKYLITLKANAALFKVDIDNGVVLEQIKSGSVENAYDLGFPYVFVDTVKGNLCVLDIECMSILKKYGSVYGSKIINPSNCISLVINDVALQGHTLTISGFEQERAVTTRDMSEYLATNKPFSRIIDTDFYAM